MTIKIEKSLRAIMGILACSMLICGIVKISSNTTTHRHDHADLIQPSDKSEIPLTAPSNEIEVPKSMQDAMRAGKKPPSMDEILKRHPNMAIPDSLPSKPQPTKKSAEMTEDELENLLKTPNLPDAMRKMLEDKLRELRAKK